MHFRFAWLMLFINTLHTNVNVENLSIVSIDFPQPNETFSFVYFHFFTFIYFQGTTKYNSSLDLIKCPFWYYSFSNGNCIITE